MSLKAITRDVSSSFNDCELLFHRRQRIDVERGAGYAMRDSRCDSRTEPGLRMRSLSRMRGGGFTDVGGLKSEVGQPNPVETCSYMGNDTILANRFWIDVEPLRGFELLDVHEEEPAAANALLLNGAIIMPHSFPKTCAPARGARLSSPGGRCVGTAKGRGRGDVLQFNF